MLAKVLLTLSVVLTLATLAWWVWDSIDYGKPLLLSKTAREVVIVEHDRLFGQEIKRVELQPGRWLGLFDAAPPFGAVPLCGLWLGLGALGLWLRKRSQMHVS
ncbi:MAG: hypothetical protein KatS3mg039_1405 [Candidatus Kapaibacterium sp.]|nr:MAG: hypothetical protein KatS3mg039_1405 [Candidatus Kapabacteria bacterium]